MEEINFHSKALMFKYRQNLFNSCCFISFVSAFDSINQSKVYNDIEIHIEESLKSQVGNHIYFENAILENPKRVKSE